MKLTSPDWIYWNNLAQVRLTDACLLSCDIEPRSVKNKHGEYFKELSTKELTSEEQQKLEEFNRRIEWAVNPIEHYSVSLRTGYREKIKDSPGRLFAEISLRWFCAWGESLAHPLNFPKEFLLAEPNKPQPEKLEELNQRIQALEAEKAKLEAENANLKKQGAVAGGLVFPYQTPELIAMHQAACQYWVNYSEDKRIPAQKELALTITETLGINRGKLANTQRLFSQKNTEIKKA